MSGAGRAGVDPRGEAVGRAFAYVLRSTAQRPRTEAEVRASLDSRGLGDVADEVLVRARAAKAVDDDAFARLWVEDRGRTRGYGAARLRQELRRRLAPEPLIADALLLVEDRDDLAVATGLARAGLGQLPPALQPEAIAAELRELQIPVAELVPDEVVQHPRGPAEVVLVERLVGRRPGGLQPRQDPAVLVGQVGGHLGRGAVVEAAQHQSRGVPQLGDEPASALDPLLGEGDVLAGGGRLAATRSGARRRRAGR